MKTRPHVVITIPCLNRGGTEIQTLYLVRALIPGGWMVSVVCFFEYDQSVVDEYREQGCEVLLMRMDRNVRQTVFIGELKHVIVELRPDVAHVQYMTPGALAIIAVRLAGVPRIFATVHQPYSAWHNRLWKVMLRSSALLCDHFISVSQNAESSWFGVSRNFSDFEGKALPKHFTIHNAVDVSLVETLIQSEDAQTMKKQVAASGHFVFGYIGRLSHEKGVDILFDAFAMLADRHAGLQLLIVGEGPEKASIEARYCSMPWWDNVMFVGKQSWMRAMQYLAAMDAVVVPSRFEGFGLSAVEAMAAFLPVVASDAGGLSEIIENGKSGLLFESGSVPGLFSAMERLFLDTETRRRLCLDARRRASDFDVELFNKKILKLYSTSIS